MVREPTLPSGTPLVVVGHGLRDRQVRGPAEVTGEPEIRSLWVRRYRILRRLGYTVLRLEAELVLRQPELAVVGVRAALGGG